MTHRRNCQTVWVILLIVLALAVTMTITACQPDPAAFLPVPPPYEEPPPEQDPAPEQGAAPDPNKGVVDKGVEGSTDVQPGSAGLQPGGQSSGGQSGGGQAGGGQVTLTMVNDIGQTVCYVYISPTTDTTWGSNWLGSSETVAAGSQRRFNVNAGTYDLMAADCSGNSLASTFGFVLNGSATWNLSSSAAAGPAPGGSSGGGSQTASLTLYNNSGATVCYVYISLSTSSDWGSDWLGSSTVPSGGSFTFNVPAGSYDLKAEDCSHNLIAVEWNMAISGSRSWTISGGAAPGGDGQASLTLYNNSGTTVCYVYISLSTDSGWGSDWLGASTVSLGGTYTFNLPPGTYDLKAEDCSHSTIDTQMGVAISGSQSWTISGGGNQTAYLNMYNNSGQTVCYVYISLSTDSGWGNDWVGASTVPSGGSYTFGLPPGTYDLRAEDCSHNVIDTQWDVAVSGNKSWTISGGGNQTAYLTVYNNSSQTVCYVYISASTDSNWGSDWLGSSTIPPGGSYTFSLPSSTYDVKAEDCSHNLIALQWEMAISGSKTWTVSGG